MLKTNILSKVLIPKIWKLSANKIIGIGDVDGLNEKSSKFQKHPILKHLFIFLRLAFTNIQIEKIISSNN